MKKKITGALFNMLTGFIFLLLSLICIFPLYYIFIVSISSQEQVAMGNVILLPKGIQLSNYARMLTLPNIADAAMVSASRTVLGTLITLFCCSFFAYLLTKKEMYFRKAVYRFIVVTMYLNAGLVPWFITMKNLRLGDNFLLYILPSAVSAFNIVLIKTYMEQISPSLEESALIDGAGTFTIFARVILPVSKPIIATIAVFASVGQWNSFYDNLFLVHKQSLMTLQMLLYQYLNEVEAIANTMKQANSMNSAMAEAFTISPTGVRMTITMIVVLPILLVYPFMQKYFVKGIMLGAIKG